MTSLTKARFEELLQAATEQNDEKKTAPKKKKARRKADEQVLEQLKEGADLQKEQDASLLANTYDATDSPRFRKNATNERCRKLPPKGGEVNKAFEGDELINNDGVERQKKVKKKSPKKLNVQANREEEIDREDDEGTQKKVKRKKRRPREVTEHSKEEEEKEDDKVVKEEHPDINNVYDIEDEDHERKTKGKKKKRKKKEEPMDEIDSKPIEYDDDGRVMGIYVHRSDRLKTDLYIAHPLVRVHLVDLNTGAYVKKSKLDRAVTSYYENRNDKLDYILPMLTQPFEYKKRKSMIPSWEELLLLNESFQYLTCGKENYPKVVVFFEILDFVSMNSVNGKSRAVAGEGGWHRVAWAFLKVLGSNKMLNTEKKVRLQLFHPPFSFKTKPGQVDVYQWWCSITRQPYPATLYITLKPVTTPSNVEPAFRSMFATQKEQGRMTYKELKRTLDGRNKAQLSDEKNPTNWSRLPGQMCRIPNKLMLSLAGGKKGCFVVKFSHDGRGIVCCCKDKSGYPLVVYDIPSGELRCEFAGHYSIIYDVCWSLYDDQLLSASSDGTARIWSLASPGGTASKVFPHPSYVYAARFHPSHSNIVATACFDHIIRFWNADNNSINGELLQELDTHKGLVNCLCFSVDGNKLYSGDSLGTIIVWKNKQSSRPSTSESSDEWQVDSIIQERELVGISINNVCMHPGGKRLLVHGRDNSIRMMDLRINAIIQRYVGALNFREHVRSTLTECGTFVISGSEDCQAYVWNTDTGDQVASYSTLGYHHPVCDVDYHPYDHILALCAYGESHPVQIYCYNAKIAQLDLGLQARPMKAWQEDSTSEHKESLTTLLQTKQNATISQDTVKSEKLERAMRKLSTVMAFSDVLQDGRKPPSRATSPAPQSLLNTQMNSTWGSTFDRSFLPTSKLGTPGPFWSPHAVLKTSTPATALLQQQSYVQKMSAPSISIQPAQSGTANFKFVSSQSKPARLHVVVAMYDYMAQRSDELTFGQGSIIKVLHEDNANWWMGEMPDGKQGYFPANYVMEQVLWPPDEKQRPPSPSSDSIDGVINGTTSKTTPQRKKIKNRRKLSKDMTEVTEDEVDGATPSRRKDKKKKVMAIESKDGELNFISATEDSEQDIPGTSRQRRRKTKQDLGESLGRVRLPAADSGSEMTPSHLPPQGKSKRKTTGTTSRRKRAEELSAGLSREASPRRRSKTDEGEANKELPKTPASGTKRKTRQNHEDRTVESLR